MAKKRAHRYHHGDLSRALLQEAVLTIQRGGVQALTLRAVGQKLGVSRTALYRHFADKSGLLAAVARESFRTLRLELVGVWEQHGGGREGLEAMGVAYVRFAVDHPSHYRVMFGRYVIPRVSTIRNLRRRAPVRFRLSSMPSCRCSSNAL